MKSLRLSISNGCKQGYGKWMITLLAFIFFPLLYAQQPDTLKGQDLHKKQIKKKTPKKINI